jgi:hypothetical protein
LKLAPGPLQDAHLEWKGGFSLSDHRVTLIEEVYGHADEQQDESSGGLIP